jgi:hypothetical protein
MRNLFRQYGDDEPAMPWRNLENTHHAMMAAKAMMRHVLWLRTERWEGVTHVSGDTCLRCERKAGVSAPIVLTGSLGVGCHRTVRYEDISIRTLRILATN